MMPWLESTLATWMIALSIVGAFSAGITIGLSCSYRLIRKAKLEAEYFRQKLLLIAELDGQFGDIKKVVDFALDTTGKEVKH